MSQSANPASDDARITPIRRQYLDIKARFPDTILLFRLGDFYETFEADAEVAASVLEIVLTSREMGKGQRVALAGIPYHAADTYIARLINAGHKVAICEQIGEATKGRGLVEREVRRVLTPGTIDDPVMLDARRNNYIAGIAIDGAVVGFAAADITTGDFIATQFGGQTLVDNLMAAGRELLRIQPAELVRPAERMGDHLPIPEAAWIPESIVRSQNEGWRWSHDSARDTVLRHFGVQSVDGFGLGSSPIAMQAAGGLLAYLLETQLDGLKQVRSLRHYSTASFMTLDAQTRRNLELEESARGERRHSLIGVLDQTRTAMGARLLRQWLSQPLLDLDELQLRQRDVRAYFEAGLERATLRTRLGNLADLQRLVNRAVTGSASPRELEAMRQTLRVIPSLQELAGVLPNPPAMPDLADVEALLTSALDDEPPAVLGKGRTIRAGFSAELDDHQVRARAAREWIANLERSERERTGIKSIKVGYNKVFGYYIEVSTAALATAERDRGTVLPAEYIAKQSISNATRYFTPELKEYETVVLTAEETLRQLEQTIYKRIVGQVATAAERLMDAAKAIAYLDVVACLAEVAVRNRYVEPELTNDDCIEIRAGRHPTLETLVPKGEYVPNDTHLDADRRIVILTGPNMAGKSSWLRQVALIVLLAQIGSYVPADRARIGLVDRIFTRIGAQDDLAGGQSTFMVEMVETAYILNHATRRSLVVLDEIGRGTSTYDGLAIAQSIVEFLHNTPDLNCKTLFATHYHELTALADVLPRVHCARMDVLEEGNRIVFLHRVVDGAADRSYGIHVAQLAGIPDAVVARARTVLDGLEHERRGGNGRLAENPVQLTFVNGNGELDTALRNLEVEALTPLEAITRLFELKKMAKP
jgi:DNA mismatch repair protein MutS